jgi:hypothetical protein
VSQHEGMARKRPPKPPAPPAPPKKYTGSIFAIPKPLPDVFVQGVEQLRVALKKDIWLIAEGPNFTLIPWMYYELRAKKSEFAGKDIVLILDSFGGSALAAYRIASLFQRVAKSFTVVIPRIAKSAATLLALGADEIILGEDAELGPLDVQIPDFDVEEGRVSALDMVQAVEQLEESAIEAATRMLKSLKDRTHKRYNLLLEPSLKFAAEVTKPLFEKIDAVSYSRRSRMLKEAEDYAVRLLVRRRFQKPEAEALARDLVKRYSTHEFVIDLDECKRLGTMYDDEGREKTQRVGLHAKGPASKEVTDAIEVLYNVIGDTLAIGRIVPL